MIGDGSATSRSPRIRRRHGRLNNFARPFRGTRRRGWRQFEASLLDREPLVAVPFYALYYPTRCEGPGQAYGFDAICTAFSRAVVEDGILLPYCGRYDATTWWSSQLILIHLANAVYGPALVLTDLVIQNQVHGR